LTGHLGGAVFLVAESEAWLDCLLALHTEDADCRFLKYADTPCVQNMMSSTKRKYLSQQLPQKHFDVLGVSVDIFSVFPEFEPLSVRHPQTLERITTIF
jgi:hypothetical protein